MFDKIYLAVMLGIIAVVLVASVPSLFRKKCRACSAKNGLEARACKQCGAAFPDD